jgi:hypothetical protein
MKYLSDENESLDISYTIFVTLLIGLGGAFLGSLIASSSTVATVKGHYCTKYNNTQEYIACKNKPIQEIYALMEKP